MPINPNLNQLPEEPLTYEESENILGFIESVGSSSNQTPLPPTTQHATELLVLQGHGSRNQGNREAPSAQVTSRPSLSGDVTSGPNGQSKCCQSSQFKEKTSSRQPDPEVEKFLKKFLQSPFPGIDVIIKKYSPHLPDGFRRSASDIAPTTVDDLHYFMKKFEAEMIKKVKGKTERELYVECLKKKRQQREDIASADESRMELEALKAIMPFSFPEESAKLDRAIAVLIQHTAFNIASIEHAYNHLRREIVAAEAMDVAHEEEVVVEEVQIGEEESTHAEDEVIQQDGNPKRLCQIESEETEYPDWQDQSTEEGSYEKYEEGHFDEHLEGDMEEQDVQDMVDDQQNDSYDQDNQEKGQMKEHSQEEVQGHQFIPSQDMDLEDLHIDPDDVDQENVVEEDDVDLLLAIRRFDEFCHDLDVSEEELDYENKFLDVLEEEYFIRAQNPPVFFTDSHSEILPGTSLLDFICKDIGPECLEVDPDEVDQEEMVEEEDDALLKARALEEELVFHEKCILEQEAYDEQMCEEAKAIELQQLVWNLIEDLQQEEDKDQREGMVDKVDHSDNTNFKSLLGKRALEEEDLSPEEVKRQCLQDPSKNTILSSMKRNQGTMEQQQMEEKIDNTVDEEQNQTHIDQKLVVLEDTLDIELLDTEVNHQDQLVPDSESADSIIHTLIIQRMIQNNQTWEQAYEDLKMEQNHGQQDCIEQVKDNVEIDIAVDFPPVDVEEDVRAPEDDHQNDNFQVQAHASALNMIQGEPEKPVEDIQSPEVQKHDEEQKDQNLCLHENADDQNQIDVLQLSKALRLPADLLDILKTAGVKGFGRNLASWLRCPQYHDLQIPGIDLSLFLFNPLGLRVDPQPVLKPASNMHLYWICEEARMGRTLTPAEKESIWRNDVSQEIKILFKEQKERILEMQREQTELGFIEAMSAKRYKTVM